jgi:8-oxo-dGTP pyrophosphatase MutT (NUDIX family)
MAPQGRHADSSQSAGTQFKRAVRHRTAGAVVFRDEDVLVMEKSNGQWVFPKGHVEHGEEPEQAAEREVLEEAGIKIDLGPLVGTTSYTFVRPDGHAEHRKRVDWFLGAWLQGEPRPEPVIFRRASFVPPAEAETLLTFEEDRGILQQSLELRATNHKAGRNGQ